MNKLYVFIIVLASLCSCKNKAPKDVDLNDRSKIERLIGDKCQEIKVDAAEFIVLSGINYSHIRDSINHLRDIYLSSINKVKYDSIISIIIPGYKDIEDVFVSIQNSEKKGIVSEYEISATNKLYDNYYAYVSKQDNELVIDIRNDQIQNIYNDFFENTTYKFNKCNIYVLESDINLLEKLCKLDSTQLIAYFDSKKTDYAKPWIPSTWEDIDKHYKEMGYSIVGVWNYSANVSFFVIFKHNNEYRYSITKFCSNPFGESSSEPMKKLSSKKFEYNQGDSDMPERFIIKEKTLETYTYNPDSPTSNKWIYMGSYDMVYP